jgi:hypothetical protein
MFGKKKAKPDSLAALHCSFCNKPQHHVRKLIAGPKVFICDECVAICIEILADDSVEVCEEPAGPHSTISACALCRLPFGVADALVVKDRGLVCSGCLREIEAAIARKGNLSS